jgi:transketolase
MGPATREAYGEALLELGQENPNVVVLDADLAKSTRTGKFAKEFPDRFFDCGICEANMTGLAAGLASCGKVVFISSFASFLMCKAFDQLRMAVAYPGENVKVVVSHGGITLGEDGASQMSVEDVALACALPGFVVMVPSDQASTKALIRQAAYRPGPVFVRVGRANTPVLYGPEEPFAIGQAKVLREGADATVIANGIMVAAALTAAEAAEADGLSVGVVDMHTVKPLDKDAVAVAARTSGALVVAEEHLTTGGLGAMVAQAVGETGPVPMAFVGLKDTYAESGKPELLLEKYGLTANDIRRAVDDVLGRK